MKTNQLSGLWHRCGTCGTIFMSMQELARHMATHKTNQPAPRRRNLTPREPVTVAPPIQTENAPNMTNDNI
ncbi:MAG: C2H2-type zinc finger protein [Chloroflexi bacterium]|nr:C2H2-type zinc finger protein [Chloroflexota bacterium]